MATISFLEVSPEQWQRDWITDPDAMFVALAGDEVIGCAGLMPDPDQPHRAEHALTAIRRDWRRRGVASALKRITLHWAATHGFLEVSPWTRRGNDDTRALNTHLGSLTRTESISVRAPLPLAGACDGAPTVGPGASDISAGACDGAPTVGPGASDISAGACDGAPTVGPGA